MKNQEVKQGITINGYLKQIENFEIELNEQELQDLHDLNELQKQMSGTDLSTEIWGTIKQAAFDSVEQMIGLDFRGDCRPDEGAIITTPLNFEKGIVASDADRKRFEMWKDRVNETYEKPYEFRDRVIKPDFNKKREVYKNKIRLRKISVIYAFLFALIVFGFFIAKLKTIMVCIALGMFTDSGSMLVAVIEKKIKSTHLGT